MRDAVTEWMEKTGVDPLTGRLVSDLGREWSDEIEAAIRDEDHCYDGSEGVPQKEPLTVKERDVLSRVLTQVLHDSRYQNEELDRLERILTKIDPRGR